jgi:hypothetical protein
MEMKLIDPGGALRNATGYGFKLRYFENALKALAKTTNDFTASRGYYLDDFTEKRLKEEEEKRKAKEAEKLKAPSQTKLAEE